MESISDMLIADLEQNPENALKLRDMVNKILLPWNKKINEVQIQTRGVNVRMSYAYVRMSLTGERVALVAPGYPLWKVLINEEQVRNAIQNESGAKDLAMSMVDEELLRKGYKLLFADPEKL